MVPLPHAAARLHWVCHAEYVSRRWIARKIYEGILIVT